MEWQESASAPAFFHDWLSQSQALDLSRFPAKGIPAIWRQISVPANTLLLVEHLPVLWHCQMFS